MNPAAMRPFGRALAAFFAGDDDATLLVRRDDGLEMPLPVSFFFRTPDQFSALESAALELCSGSVLDVGAGTGRHSLALQQRGHRVTALDISPEAVRIMNARGLDDVRRGDIMHFEDGPFDTLLLLGHGIGMVEDLAGLRAFLAQVHRLVATGGQVLIESVDVRVTDEPAHLAYHETRRHAGHYIGETRMQFEFGGETGEFCGWLHVDPETLDEFASAAGWGCEIIRKTDGGEYLARLTRVRRERQ